MDLSKRSFWSIANYLAPYVPSISVIALAIICAEFGIRAIQLPMKGIEHEPSFSAIALHMFSHIHGLHFLGNFAGMFFYAWMFSVAMRRVDMRRNNSLFLASMALTVIVSTSLALFVWPNDNGVSGMSGVVNFLMGYFWIGCVSIVLVSYATNRRIRIFIRIDRIIEQHASWAPVGMLLLICALHWAYDRFADFIPYGENALGKLYHLVGFSIGSLAGVVSALLWLETEKSEKRAKFRN